MINMENAILNEKIAALGKASAAVGLPCLRVDREDGGAVLLLSQNPDRYVELQVDQDGIAQAVARQQDEDEPACWGLPADRLVSRLAQLARFVRTGTFSMDLAA